MIISNYFETKLTGININSVFANGMEKNLYRMQLLNVDYGCKATTGVQYKTLLSQAGSAG